MITKSASQSPCTKVGDNFLQLLSCVLIISTMIMPAAYRFMLLREQSMLVRTLINVLLGTHFQALTVQLKICNRF